MTPSLVGLLDNRCKRSSSPVQLSSEASAAVSDPVDGGEGATFPLGIFVSAALVSGACEAVTAEGVVGGASLSTSARADWAWAPSGWAVRNARNPSDEFVRSAI